MVARRSSLSVRLRLAATALALGIGPWSTVEDAFAAVRWRAIGGAISGWDPPQVGGSPEVPVVATEKAPRWWARRYGGVPVWGWAVGGLIALSAAGAATDQGGEGQVASMDAASEPTTDTRGAEELSAPASQSADTTAVSTLTTTSEPPAPATTTAPTTLQRAERSRVRADVAVCEPAYPAARVAPP